MDYRPGRIAAENLGDTSLYVPTLSVWRCREICPRERGGRERRWPIELCGQSRVETIAACFLECFGVPGNEAAGFCRPAVIAQPACAIERMEACQRGDFVVADIVEPAAVPERGLPRWLDKIDYDVNPGSNGS